MHSKTREKEAQNLVKKPVELPTKTVIIEFYVFERVESSLQEATVQKLEDCPILLISN